MKKCLSFLVIPAVVLPALAAGKQSGTVPAPAPSVLRGPLDVLHLYRQNRAGLAHTRLEDSSVEAVFDGNPRSAVRAGIAGAGSVPGEALFQVNLDRPRVVEEIDVAFADPGVQYQWSVAAADSEADMRDRRRSYRILVATRSAPGEGWAQALPAERRPCRIFRLECRRLTPGPVALAEWSLGCPQQLLRLEVDAFAPTVARGGLLQLRAGARFDGGARLNVTRDARWVVSPPSRGHVDELARLHGGEPGPALIRARVEGALSAPLRVNVLAEGRPDWDVTYIERNPRVPRGERPSATQAAQTVYWFAHLRNYGTADGPPVPVEWRVDGKTVFSGWLPKLERFRRSEAMLRLLWDGKRRELELVVDPRDEVPETSEANNRLRVATDARTVGFWVEESTLRYFHRHQAELGIGSNSWEDWAQRQVAFWNGAAEGPQKHRGAPWRLDRIVVVGDGVLPLSQGSAARAPDERDRTVQWMWGFPAADVERTGLYRRTSEKSLDNPFYYHAALSRAAEGGGTN